jgi:DNA-binding response OmpR family regulator
VTSALQRPHVLIVSDDTDLGSFLGEGLVYAGFWTSTIAGAFQTLEVFRLRSFDIVLLDAALGGIGALELVRRLRGRSDRGPADARTDVPILMVAASADEVMPARAVEAGATGILVAPIELPDLARRLSETVSHWRSAHPGRPWADEAALAR